MFARPLKHVVIVGLGVAVCSIANAEPIRYSIKPNQVVAYTVTITAETPTSVETMKGVIAFTGKQQEGDKLTIEYSGGLRKTAKSKVRRTGPPRGGFGRRPGGPPSRRSPFDQPDFRGLVASKSTLVITNCGGIESMRGDSQIPYLLGHVSLLPFEALPPNDKTEWQDGNSLTITSGGSSNSRFGPRRGPFATSDDVKTKTGGGEIASYKVQNDDGKRVTISKTYSLTSPPPTKSKTGFEMKGTGTWVFNRELGVSESMDYKAELTIESNNTQTKIPITIAWKRMADDEYAAHTKKVAEQRAALIAKANKPVDPVRINSFHKKNSMSRLKNRIWSAAWGELESLSRSRMTGLVKEDMDLMTQVGILRAHSNEKVRKSAEKVWKKWQHSFEELATKEQKAAVAAALAIDTSKPASESNPFVTEGEDNGKEARTWSDTTGRFKIEAEFHKLDGRFVVLKKVDGKLVRIPKARLSKADQALVDQLSK